MACPPGIVTKGMVTTGMVTKGIQQRILAPLALAVDLEHTLTR